MHDYPKELAELVLSSWPEDLPPPPGDEALTRLLSVCYQASLLREEARLTTFRLLLGDPDELSPRGGPPRGLQVLPFDAPRALTPDQLRRLCPAVEFYRAMVGAQLDGDRMQLWGLVYTGPRWVRETLGGRSSGQDLPMWPTIHVHGPGDLSVHCGMRPLATLRGGSIETGGFDVFQALWLPEHFRAVRAEAIELHRRAREDEGSGWAELDPDFIRALAQHVVRRTIAVMRAAGHGGTVLFLPHGAAEELAEQGHLSIKYRFSDLPSRRRFRSLLVRVTNALARTGEAGTTVGWRDYLKSDAADLTELDEGIFEIGQLFAALSAVDGALVLTERFEVLGFGAEISGALEPVHVVWRAVDVEARDRQADAAETFGTRHRSVFRLCQAHPDLLAIVVSQDRQVRFVKQLGERVTYFVHRVPDVL